MPVFFGQAQEFPIATGSYSQTYPSAAYANGLYYNAFLDKSTSSSAYGFHGKFIETGGTVLPGEPVIVPPIYSLSFMHEIIWGEAGYLFVWSRGRSSGWTRDAYGQLVYQDGNPQGAKFQISIGNSESASFVEAAFDGENYLVVWQEGMPNSGSVIRAQFVSQDGQLVGDNFSVRPSALGTDVDQIYPDVEYDGEKYLVVWDDDRNGNRDIFGQFIDIEGNFLGEDLAICTHSADQLLVQLAFGGENYYAVWGDERLSTNDKGIFGQLIALDGTMIGENLSISPPANSEGRTWPDVAASNNEYLVVWDQEWLEYKTGTGSKNTPEVWKYQAAGVAMPKPTVWYDIYARKIAFDGTCASDEMAICTADYHQQDCDVASDGTDFLVSWSDSRNNNAYYDIYGYIVEGSAVPVLPEFSVDELVFNTLEQFYSGGEEFYMINPNNFEISIDDIFFLAPEMHYWFLIEQPAFPVIIPANDSAGFTVNMELPVGKHRSKSFDTDTLVAQTMDEEVELILKVDEALLDTIFTIKMDYTVDSLFFQTVDQALEGETVGLINRHMPKIYISDAYVSTSYGIWEIEPEFALPYFIFMNDTLDFHIRAAEPLKETLSGIIAIDTLWFDSWDTTKYCFPIYYYTEIIDTIWTGIHSHTEVPDFRLIPNPASEKAVLYFSNEGADRAIISILNLSGMLVKKMNIKGLSSGDQEISIPLNGIKSGIYLLRLDLSEKSHNQKLMIRK